VLDPASKAAVLALDSQVQMTGTINSELQVGAGGWCAAAESWGSYCLSASCSRGEGLNRARMCGSASEHSPGRPACSACSDKLRARPLVSVGYFFMHFLPPFIRLFPICRRSPLPFGTTATSLVGGTVVGIFDILRSGGRAMICGAQEAMLFGALGVGAALSVSPYLRLKVRRSHIVADSLLVSPALTG